ncbi:MAG TPA: response regulator [Thermoanaerobaculia bacterium]|nr:response regulator [Thermoanaerobaculia bacterium]
MANEPRVLIIEDHDALRAMLFAVLRHQPLAVDTAATLTDALERVASCDYALILIDMSLARDGAEKFFDGYRRINPDASSFIIAVRDPKHDVYIDPDIVSAVINKPLEIDTLAEVVRECAAVMPPSESSVPCPPAESEVRDKFDRGSLMPN